MTRDHFERDVRRIERANEIASDEQSVESDDVDGREALGLFEDHDPVPADD